MEDLNQLIYILIKCLYYQPWKSMSFVLQPKNDIPLTKVLQPSFNFTPPGRGLVLTISGVLLLFKYSLKNVRKNNRK